VTTLPPSLCRKSRKSGSLNLPDPQGPLQACSGKTLPFTTVIIAATTATVTVTTRITATIATTTDNNNNNIIIIIIIINTLFC
jgi:hypothetical protein